MPVYRFQKNFPFTLSELQRFGSLGISEVSAPQPAELVDITATAPSLSDLQEYMTAQGYTLIATDPVATLAVAASAVVPPVTALRESGGTQLNIGAISDGQFMRRSGSNVQGVASTFDVRDVVVWDHFVTSNLDLDELGSAGWRTSVAGTGSGIATVGEAGHPGIIQLEGGTVLAGRSGFHLGESAALNNFQLNASQGQIDNEWLIKLVGAGTLSAVNTERVTLGFGDEYDAAGGTEHLNGIYAEFNPSTSAQWLLRTANGGARSSQASGINAVADAWVRIGIRMTYPGGVPTAQLLINGTPVGASLSTNIPTTVTGLGVRIDANSLNPTMQVDYCLVAQVTNKET